MKLQEILYPVLVVARTVEEELTSNVRLQGTMANLKAKFHGHLIRPRDVF